MKLHTLAVSGLVVVALYGSIFALAFAFQNQLLFFPSRHLVVTPADAGLDFDVARIETDDGETLHSWWIPATDAGSSSSSARSRAGPGVAAVKGAGAKRTILFFHGNAGNISGRVPIGKQLHDLGYNVLLVGYRGYGKSTGSPSEDGFYRDAEAAWRYATEEQGVAPSDVILLGRSLGGAPATWLATQVEPRALVLESAFTSVPDVAAHHYPFLPARWLSRIQFDNLARVRDLDMPVVVVHGTADEVVPFAHGRQLFEAAGEPKHFVETSARHIGPMSMTDRGREEALQWLARDR
jgi:uncharacterized protein